MSPVSIISPLPGLGTLVDSFPHKYADFPSDPSKTLIFDSGLH